jgi:hypothetical protein
MHALNNEKTIGKYFFIKPTHAQAVRLEHIYNKLFGTLPTTLNFTEEFEPSCLKKLSEFFSPFSSNITKTGAHYLEEGIYVGNPDTPYENTLVSADLRTPDGETVFYDGALISHSGRNSTSTSLNLSSLYVRVRVVCHTKQQAQKIAELLEGHKIQQKSKIYILASAYGDLSFTALPIVAPDMNLELNYGEEFVKISESLIASLNNERSGLYLFHGSPGTGKSSYIKYLCSGVVNRKIVYIPVGLIGSLTSPDMMPLLMENKDLILVIEDAEKALVSRDESGRSDLVSTILNLTDGFLGGALNITVVATFNTAKEKIDDALLRKGRLKHCYEFTKLTKKQAQKLAASIGLSAGDVTADMTLADIYHLKSETGYTPEEQRRVGFF